jgi:spermidine synthase
MFWYFFFFFVSGFCGILYEVVWLRLAMAQFGVTTPIVSTVLATFMGGLGAGSWVAGRLVRLYGERIGFSVLRLYALMELLIGCSAFILPAEFTVGHRLLQSLSQESISSSAYYVVSGAVIAIAMVPWCACMGATIPLAMSSIREEGRAGTERSFSFLYLSNVVGAMFGAAVPLFLIEKHGFRFTLSVGAILNFGIAVLAFAATFVFRRRSIMVSDVAAGPAVHRGRNQHILLLLFLTGLTTMAMEVVWIRLFTVYLGPLVYSFALILCSYLFGTFLGSSLYRDASAAEHFRESRAVWILIPLLGALPLLLADPRVPFATILRPIVAVAPFAAAAGFLTPMLVDRWSAGDPDRAGYAYAINVLGCIIGPLLCGFVLLPLAGEHWSMVLLVLPWLAIAFPWRRFRGAAARTVAYIAMGTCLVLLIVTKDYEILFTPRTVLRDSTATVTAAGTGMRKQLLVNGTGMTMLQPTTKMMAHLTLASLAEPPRNALVICFGMGTTYRSVISWGIPGTAVELVPSVPRLFYFYHSDAEKILASPLSHVIIDDGRRFLERSTQKFDAIIIDPPPPVWAAGSSLLYSEEFYRLAQQHMSYDAILQQWLPGAGEVVQASVARALSESFPYVRVFPALEPSGWHFLASMHPIPVRTAQQLAQRMPPAAIADMLEWGPAKSPEEQLQLLLSKEMTTAEMIARAPDTPALCDDRPVNEYFLLRTLFPKGIKKVQISAAQGNAR